VKTHLAAVEGPIPLADVDAEMARQLNKIRVPGEGPVQRARMSNLVIYCNSAAMAGQVAAEVPEIIALHPARVLLLVAEAEAAPAETTAALQAWCQVSEHIHICSEQITLRAGGPRVEQLPFAVRGLLIGDLPVNLWWAAPVPPPLGGPLLHDLAEHVQQIVYDSIGWPEPARGMAATAAWLAKFERGRRPTPWPVVSDLNWRRLKYWRRLLGQALDPATAPGALDSITEVQVEHGPHAVIQAWELVSWLASRLGWLVQTGKVEPNVQIAWHCRAPQGAVRLRIHRLAEGPSEVRRVRIACTLNGEPAALDMAVEGERLAVRLEGAAGEPRTMTVQPQPAHELVARQLSDREYDPVFHESVAVAQVLAQSVLR
jgi:glucose-6-phosphate dehydrogenase assembly protein OpcA